MALVVTRIVFLVVAAGVAVLLINAPGGAPLSLELDQHPTPVFLVVVGIACAAIAVDWFVRSKRLEVISAIYFGLLVGLFLAYIVGLALTPIEMTDSVRQGLQLVLGMVLCYMCISVLLQTKDDFRFIIPYVEFAKDVKGVKPLLLDTSVVIDGRIADVVETKAFEAPLIMPTFVLKELQSIADSSDRLRRGRGRRGLDILNRLRTNEELEFQLLDREPSDSAGKPVDERLVLLAKELNGKIVTGDYNLNKIARLHDVGVINLNDLANSLKPVFLPGEQISVRLVKRGEESTQGVGYLDDGTMVVVEGGSDHLGETVGIVVTSVLQTSAGRMVFGRFETTAQPA